MDGLFLVQISNMDMDTNISIWMDCFELVSTYGYRYGYPLKGLWFLVVYFEVENSFRFIDGIFDWGICKSTKFFSPFNSMTGAPSIHIACCPVWKFNYLDLILVFAAVLIMNMSSYDYILTCNGKIGTINFENEEAHLKLNLRRACSISFFISSSEILCKM